MILTRYYLTVHHPSFSYLRIFAFAPASLHHRSPRRGRKKTNPQGREFDRGIRRTPCHYGTKRLREIDPREYTHGTPELRSNEWINRVRRQ